MKKIIFGGFCMAASIIGILFMINEATTLNEFYGGSLNSSSNVMMYLKRLGITQHFYIFSWLGIIGFGIGVWGLFDRKD